MRWEKRPISDEHNLLLKRIALLRTALKVIAETGALETARSAAATALHNDDLGAREFEQAVAQSGAATGGAGGTNRSGPFETIGGGIDQVVSSPWFPEVVSAAVGAIAEARQHWRSREPRKRARFYRRSHGRRRACE